MAKEFQAPTRAYRSQRPAGVTLLALGGLMIGGLNLLRGIQALQQWAFLEELLPISPLYLALTGLGWAGIELVLAEGLWRGREWARRSALPTGLGYSLYYWADRLLLTGDRPGSNWPFAAGMTVLLLALVLWIVTRRRTRAFFQDRMPD